jgi:3-dehydroquinate synthase
MQGVRYAIVADVAVAPLAATLAQTLAGDGLLLGEPVFVPSGESSKSFAMLSRVIGALLDLGAERNDGVIALGGGVTGDLVGFAAAILKRGVRLVQIPTTLLAQVDSSVGGKTGINAPQGKNLIGAFHQPSLVLADLDALATLPLREFRSGYAEIVKYGMLGDAGFFGWLEANQQAVFARDEAALTFAIKKSCEMKAAIVVRDELEAGDRALLNLGHTFGHAVEAWAGYSGEVLHGEAIALGMVLAAAFSRDRGLCDRQVVERLESQLQTCGFATNFAALRARIGRAPSGEDLLVFMGQDKKVRSGALNLVLLRGIGEAFVEANVAKADVLRFLGGQLDV